ncbi:hypothetical protein DERF_008289 [Dermatophagoides farinae]|uniref:Uncharacterized protein n=1 Tax=Dermatophagoides farinae TaxID=6954 RepID=A0A922I239_DERFA|nr:hypothetical protein DERF_008289 [Dermatophagoides farinae]
MYCAIVHHHQAFKMQKKDDAAPSYSTGKKCNFLMDEKTKPNHSAISLQTINQYPNNKQKQ